MKAYLEYLTKRNNNAFVILVNEILQEGNRLKAYLDGIKNMHLNITYMNIAPYQKFPVTIKDFRGAPIPITRTSYLQLE